MKRYSGWLPKVHGEVIFVLRPFKGIQRLRKKWTTFRYLNFATVTGLLIPLSWLPFPQHFDLTIRYGIRHLWILTDGGQFFITQKAKYSRLFDGPSGFSPAAKQKINLYTVWETSLDMKEYQHKDELMDKPIREAESVEPKIDEPKG